MSNISLHTHFATSNFFLFQPKPTVRGRSPGSLSVQRKGSPLPTHIIYWFREIQCSSSQGRNCTWDHCWIENTDLEGPRILLSPRRQADCRSLDFQCKLVQLYSDSSRESFSWIFLCCSACPFRKKTRTQDSCSRRSFRADVP